MKIISITGTKGKTTITRAMSNILHKLGDTTLRVDTDGHYINEKQLSTLDDSRNLFTKAPTVCPGKYLITMKKHFPNFTAVLETAIGSNGAHGLGYGFHQIGIFTNVLEDHMGITKSLKNRQDLANAKSFIFKRIDDSGYLIFNADDKYVCSQLKKIPEYRNPTLIPVGISFKYFDLKNHLLNNGEVLTIENNYIVIKSKKNTKRILDTRKIKWTFDGIYLPSIFNLMFVLAGIYSFFDKKIEKKALESIKNYDFDKYGGRLTMLKNKQNIKILVDYAHEKYSLKEIAKLGNELKANKTIGVVRLAPDRTDKMIFDTGKAIAKSFDHTIIYDKIDGKNRGRYVGKNINITREIGEVSNIFLRGVLSQKNASAERIIIEEDAIKHAAKIARPGDCVVIICGDSHKKTISHIKKFFKAHF